MESLARRFTESRRAFPLGRLTALFLDRLNALVIRLSPEPRSSDDESVPLTLFQCRLCRMVSLEKELAIQHVLTQHQDRFYRLRDIVCEPPNGNFVCVARCGLSGEMIGPPNYHGYHDRLTRLHRERFPHLTFETYRSKLEMCRDPEVIEAWKQSMGKKTVYEPIDAADSRNASPGTEPREPAPPEAEAPAADTETEAATEAGRDKHALEGYPDVKQHFLQHTYADVIQESHACVIPGTVARTLEDEKLRHWIESAWRRESRSIMRTAITVRGIFRSLGFSAFKTADQQVYMTAVAPNPLQDEKAVDTIKRMLEYVDQHPGCTRADLWKHLGINHENDAGTPAARHFRLLVDKGRLIFFHDGTLTLPHHLHAIRGPTASKHPKRKKSGSKKKKSKS